MAIEIDPTGAAIDAAATVAWMLLSWLTFRLVIDTIHSITKRVRHGLDTTVVVGRGIQKASKHIRQKLG